METKSWLQFDRRSSGSGQELNSSVDSSKTAILQASYQQSSEAGTQPDENPRRTCRSVKPQPPNQSAAGPHRMLISDPPIPPQRSHTTSTSMKTTPVLQTLRKRYQSTPNLRKKISTSFMNQNTSKDDNVISADVQRTPQYAKSKMQTKSYFEDDSEDDSGFRHEMKGLFKRVFKPNTKKTT